MVIKNQETSIHSYKQTEHKPLLHCNDNHLDENVPGTFWPPLVYKRQFAVTTAGVIVIFYNEFLRVCHLYMICLSICYNCVYRYTTLVLLSHQE